MVEGREEEDVFYSPMIRSQSFSEHMPGAMIIIVLISTHYSSSNWNATSVTIPVSTSTGSTSLFT